MSQRYVHRGARATTRRPPEVFGGYKPTSATTGAPAGLALTVQTGNVTITTAGTLIEGIDLHGYLDVRANNVIVRRSIIRGLDAGPGTTQTALVSCFTGSPSGVTFEDCTLLPTVQTVYVDGIKGSGFTATRLDVSGTVDLGVIFGNRATTVQGCYLHDNVQYASDPNQSGGASHNDGLQIQQATSVTVRGNTIRIATPGNSCMQVTQDVGLINGLTIDRNWIDGGNLGLNTSEKAQGPYTGFVVTGNRFGRSFALGTGTTVGVITPTTKTAATITGNVREDDATAVTFGNAGS